MIRRFNTADGRVRRRRPMRANGGDEGGALFDRRRIRDARNACGSMLGAPLGGHAPTRGFVRKGADLAPRTSGFPRAPFMARGAGGRFGDFVQRAENFGVPFEDRGVDPGPSSWPARGGPQEGVKGPMRGPWSPERWAGAGPRTRARGAPRHPVLTARPSSIHSYRCVDPRSRQMGPSTPFRFSSIKRIGSSRRYGRQQFYNI